MSIFCENTNIFWKFQCEIGLSIRCFDLIRKCGFCVKASIDGAHSYRWRRGWQFLKLPTLWVYWVFYLFVRCPNPPVTGSSMELSPGHRCEHHQSGRRRNHPVICDTPLHIPRVTEAACLGAAILASVGAGNYENVNSAVREAVKIDRTISPCSKNVEAYRPRYELYQELYPKLVPLLRR